MSRMPFRTWLRTLTCLGIIGVSAVVWSLQGGPRQIPLADVVPGDTIAYVSFPDIRSSWNVLQDSNLHKAWSDEEIQLMLEPVLAAVNEQIEAVNGNLEAMYEGDLESTLDLFQGQVSFALLPAVGEPDHRKPPFEQLVGAIDLGASATDFNTYLGNYITKMKEGNPEMPDPSFEVDGRTAWRFGSEETMVYGCVLEGTLFLTMSEATMSTVLATGGNAIEGALSSTELFKSATTEVSTDKPVLQIFVNGSEFIAWAETQRMIPPAEAPERESLEQSGLLSITSLSLGVAFENGQFVESVHIGLPEARTGVFAWLSGLGAVQEGAETWVPSDALYHARFNLQPDGFWSLLNELLGQGSPDGLADLEKQLEEQFGIDPNGILSSVEGTVVSWASMPEAGGLLPNGYEVVTLKSPLKFWEALDKIRNHYNVERAEVAFRGKTIHYLQVQPGSEFASRLDLDFFDGRGDPTDMIASVLFATAWIEDEGNRVIFCDSVPAAKRLILRGKPTSPARMPAGEGHVFLDLGQIAASWYNTIAPMAARMGPILQQQGIPFDAARLPLGETLERVLGTAMIRVKSDATGLRASISSDLGVSSLVSLLGAAGGFFYSQAGRGAGNPAMNEEMAIMRLGTLRNVESMWRQADFDGNGMNDFWTADVAGLFGYTDANGNAVLMVPKSMAEADSNPNDLYGGLDQFGVPVDGYLFMAIPLDVDGNKYALDADADGNANTNQNRFAFTAYPAQYGRTGTRTFIISEEGQVYGSDAVGAPCVQWPAEDPTTAGWAAVGN